MNRTLIEAQKHCNLEYPNILEFGVYKGKTIQQLRNQFNDSFNIFGFDSFEGLPEAWSGTSHKKGDMSTGGNIPNVPGVKFYKGWFKDTIREYITDHTPDWFEEDNKYNITLLHIDCDLFSSTIDILAGLNQYIQQGTVIVFDEWYYNHDPKFNDHEQKAFYEWVAEFQREYILLPQIEDERQIVIIQK